MKPPPFARLPLDFDAAPMLAEAAALGDARWIPHFNDGCHDGAWQGVALRAVEGDPARLYADGARRDAIRDTDLLAGAPCIAAALARIECPLRSVRLLRLAPGGVIREHRDDDLRFGGGEARLHIPLATNPEVEFYVDDQRVVMQAGECWYLDLSRPHRVQNRGTSERIHLVVDCGVNDWLVRQVAASVASGRTSTQRSGQESFAAFRDHVLGDDALQEQLRTVEDADAFAAKAVELGAQHGYGFTPEDVRAAMIRGRQAWYSQWVL